MSTSVLAKSMTDEGGGAFRTFWMSAALFAVLYVLVLAVADPNAGWTLEQTSFAAALGVLLVLASAWDVHCFRLPDALNAAIALLGLFYTLRTGGDVVVALAGAAVGYLSLVCIRTVYQHLRGRPGLGLGDAKLLAAAGTWVGFEGLSAVVLVGSCLALALIAAAWCAGRTIKATDRIPFGPFLAFGLWVSWLLGV